MPRLEPIAAGRGEPPRLAGRYIVTRLLGKGAQARVYLGFDDRLRRWRAIKVLAANFLDDRGVRERFDQEAQVMARLAHDNVVRVADVAEDGQTPFMVMELARGGSVTEWLKRNGPMPPGLACDVAVMTCLGLEHSHEQGVVHRDVKPHNLLIKADGTVCLTDFGIARVDDDRASMTATGSVMGTFAYMAPEQRSDSKAVDERADVYAVGATLFTLLTMRTSAELFFAEARDEILDGVPPLLQEVVLKACQYDPDDRFPTMRDLREAIEETAEFIAEPVDRAALTDGVFEVPDEPPARLDPGAGVADLKRALSPGNDDAPTMLEANRSRLAEMLDEQPTTLYSDTNPPTDDETDEGDDPVVMPYTMSDPRHKSFGRVPAERASSVLGLSEEGRLYQNSAKPALDRSMSPAPSSGRRSEVRITNAGTERIVEAEAPEERGPWTIAAVAVGFAVFLIVGTLSYGVVNKALASRSLESSQVALVETIRAEASLVKALDQQGVDVSELYFAADEARGDDRGEAGTAYVRQVLEAADGVELDSVGRGQVTLLRQALDDYRVAQAWVSSARSSRLGQLTGDLGL